MQNAQLAPSPGKLKFVQVAAVAKTRLTPARLKAFRETHKLSQNQFAEMFQWSRYHKPYTRNYISMLERAKLPITRGFEKKFYRVREQLRAQKNKPTDSAIARESEIIADFVLPVRLHIIPAPRRCERPRCPTCKQNHTKWFVPRTPNQRKHVISAKRKK